MVLTYKVACPKNPEEVQVFVRPGKSFCELSFCTAKKRSSVHAQKTAEPFPPEKCIIISLMIA